MNGKIRIVPFNHFLSAILYPPSLLLYTAVSHAQRLCRLGHSEPNYAFDPQRYCPKSRGERLVQSGALWRRVSQHM